MKIKLNKLSKNLIIELAKDENVKNILINHGVIEEQIVIPLKYILKTPNDMELGTLIRNLSNQ